MTGKILVVDPVATNRIVLKAKLSAHFYDAESVQGAPQALAAARNLAPDMIVIADRLPDAGTAGLCTALRDAEATADVPIIVLSDCAPGPARAACLIAGADDLLDRSSGDAVLFARIRTMLKEAAARRDLACRLNAVAFSRAVRIEWSTEPRGQIGWVSDRRATALGHQIRLGTDYVGRIKIMDPATIPGRAPTNAGPDVYIIDHDLGPHGTALGLLSDLRTRDHSREADALLLMDSPRDMAAALDLGAGSVLVGPVEPAELAARLTALMRRKRQRVRLRQSIDASLAEAEIDALTGLQNRRATMAGLSEAARSARRVAVLMIDVDHFKSVNDRYGHAAGDAALTAIAAQLRKSLPGARVIGRIGGEEFLACIDALDPQAVRDLAEKARCDIAGMVVPTAKTPDGLRMTVSIGIAFGGPGQAQSHVLSAADGALYEAKNTGRNRICFSEAQPA